MVRVGSLVLALLLLTACGRKAPELDAPTPPSTMITITTSPTTAPIVLASATPLPAGTVPSPTASIVPVTKTPIVTANPPVTPTPADVEYRVAFVAANDVLNVRLRPDPAAPIVTELAADAAGIRVTGPGRNLPDGSIWRPVTTDRGDGWVNGDYLVEVVERDTFCGDPAVDDLLHRLRMAIAEQDGTMFSELVHPERGLRLRVNWWNNEIIVRDDGLVDLFRSTTVYDWGFEDGSGKPIRGSFGDVILPRLERDLLGAGEWTCDEGLFGPTAGSTYLPEGYEALRYYSAHRAGSDADDPDWGTWLVGIERSQGRYTISYLVHYRWEI